MNWWFRRPWLFVPTFGQFIVGGIGGLVVVLFILLANEGMLRSAFAMYLGMRAFDNLCDIVPTDRRAP